MSAKGIHQGFPQLVSKNKLINIITTRQRGMSQNILLFISLFEWTEHGQSRGNVLISLHIHQENNNTMDRI